MVELTDSNYGFIGKVLKAPDGTPFLKTCAIVSSGYSNDPVMAEYGRYGFAAAVPKPYRLNDLVQVLHDLVGR
jgi:hypothetical protein